MAGGGGRTPELAGSVNPMNVPVCIRIKASSGDNEYQPIPWMNIPSRELRPGRIVTIGVSATGSRHKVYKGFVEGHQLETDDLSLLPPTEDQAGQERPHCDN